jgi:hypothetical protein
MELDNLFSTWTILFSAATNVLAWFNTSSKLRLGRTTWPNRSSRWCISEQRQTK